MNEVVRVEGLKELDRAFGRINKDLRRELRKGLRRAAKVVATEGQQIARDKGLVRTGRLVKGIRPGATGDAVFVRARALKDAFNYAPVYEFGAGGRRAFLGPAVQRKRGEVVDEIEKVLDEMAAANGF